MKGLVFSIEEFSVFDGPGVRTTVFLKGCPLHCEWCHNPEGQETGNRIIRSRNGCLQCGRCEAEAAAEDGRLRYTAKSMALCPNHLLRYCAREYTAEELVRKIAKNFHFLNKGGGITFSGGEPLLQHEFLTACLSLLEGKTHRAIQTSGFAAPEIFRNALSHADYMLFDLKLMDETEHIRYTGVSNKAILQNFAFLCQSGVPFVARTPLIPHVTDTPENLTAIARALSSHGIKAIELLPYNKMAGAKYALIEETCAPSFDTSAECSPRTEIFKSYGIAARIV